MPAGELLGGGTGEGYPGPMKAGAALEHRALVGGGVIWRDDVPVIRWSSAIVESSAFWLEGAFVAP